ncbi:hypothetical protein [Haloferula sp.]|uniref:hypothetical protein n=1 Tax=Haloferula sp. TaxID=2497595 RepID=UPI003C77A339
MLKRSTDATGDLWKRYQEVEVSYDGDWTGLVKRLQPDLVDAEFRKSSREIYEPRSRVVKQWHRGPGGTKTVIRTPGKVEVNYEDVGDKAVTEEIRDASALVADAYTAFLFGASFLLEEGQSLELLKEEELGGEVCDRVQGRLSPGFGFSEEDRFVVWIGRDSGWMRRLQFTIDGLASTRGADVEVSFFDHWQAKDGSIWPGRFVEWVERPVHVKAHEWWMTALEVDGKRLK